MKTFQNYRPYNSGLSFKSSKSTDNYYRRAAEHTVKYQSTAVQECLACKHEQENQVGTVQSPAKSRNIYLSGKSVRNEYYQTTGKDKDELQHLKKSKQYLEQLLDRTKNDHQKSISIYERRIDDLNKELTQKSTALLEVRKVQTRKEAENVYLANASLVRSYKQMNLNDDEVDRERGRKVKQLLRRNSQLQQQIASLRQTSEERRQQIESLELKLAKIQELPFLQRQYQAMKVLIDKMQEQKLQLLDRQHLQIQQIEDRQKGEVEEYRAKVEELREQLEEKMFKLTENQRELVNIRSNFNQYRGEQYQALRELIEERDKEVMALQSRLNCIDSELTFVKGRYGHLLRLTQTGQLVESLVEPEEYCLERVGRYNVSNGKESMMSMNLSPIKRR